MLVAMSPMTVRLTVSDILDKRGITTSDFAKMADLTYGQARAIRRGFYDRIDLNTIARICEALKIEPGELFVSVPRQAEESEAT